MSNPASGSDDHPRDANPATTPAATTVTDNQPGADNAVPAVAESTQKPQVVNPQAGHEEDEDSDFDELDGKRDLSTPPPSHTTSHTMQSSTARNN
jgi:hypothetical protein